MPEYNDYNRRNVLKMTSGLATGLTVGAVGTVAADDTASSLEGVDAEACDCYYEYKCDGSCYKDGSYPQSWERECCECDGGTTCDSWSRMGRCCL